MNIYINIILKGNYIDWVIMKLGATVFTFNFHNTSIPSRAKKNHKNPPTQRPTPTPHAPSMHDCACMTQLVMIVPTAPKAWSVQKTRNCLEIHHYSHIFGGIYRKVPLGI